MEDKLMLETGIKGRQEVVVSDATPQKQWEDGTLDVFATPAMTALMEKTAWMSVADQLDEGCGTVGTLLNVTHDAPTPLGMTVWCETELVEVDGRRLVFRCCRLRRQRKDRRRPPRALHYPERKVPGESEQEGTC